MSFMALPTIISQLFKYTTHMKTYVLMVSEFFPKTHKRAGEPTGFPLAIKHYDKIHTIRGNYQLWAKRFQEINKGNAYLSVRIWTGKPYQTKQVEIFRYDNTHKIGIEKLSCNPLGWVINDTLLEELKTEVLAKNDGLTEPDFKEWFKGSFVVDNSKAIIHFTDFRYCQKATDFPTEFDDNAIDEIEFYPCDDCDLPDACSDHGCAIKAGIKKSPSW